MATTPFRLRNWARIVRDTSLPLGEYHQQTVANMLEHCANRFEEYEARIKELETMTTHRPNTWMESESSVCVIDNEPWPCTHAREDKPHPDHDPTCQECGSFPGRCTIHCRTIYLSEEAFNRFLALLEEDDEDLPDE